MPGRLPCAVGHHAASLLVWLSKANHTYVVGLRSTHFAVHFLTTDDFALAKRFGTLSGEDTDKFAGLDVELDPHGIPDLKACANRMSLERIAVLDDGSDHVCVTTRVRAARNKGPFVPLRVSSAARLVAGHSSDRRAIQP
jgi:flavin reductase (DIM6/NTAB) family NADH-FMN oxidoreductase RutF